MAKKKPYWVRSLLKLKPRVREIEEEMKRRKTVASPMPSKNVAPTKTWKFDWHFSWKPSSASRLIIIILGAFLIASVLPSSCSVRVNVDQTVTTSTP